jgi:hypothetical protein
MDNEAAAEPEPKDVTIPGLTAKAVFSANVPEVKIELDRIVQILEGTNKNVEQIKNLAITTNESSRNTKEGIRVTKLGVIATITLSSAAIAISLINIALQLKII